MSIPRPEYPRPQLVRSAWLNLNGRWGFAFDPGRSGVQRGLPGANSLPREIVVPFCAESLLSEIGDMDFHPGAWYRRTFRVPEDWQGQRVLLQLGAVDHDTTVWVNGRQVGVHRGGYTPFQIEITDALQRDENTLVVYAEDETRSPLQATGKQSPQYNSYACLYTRTTGIWQTVWMEPVPPTYVDNLRLTPDLLNGRVSIEVDIAGTPSRGTLQARALLDGEVVGEVAQRYAGQHAIAMLDLREVHPWAPESPTLYDLELILTPDGGHADSISSYFGLRSLGIDGVALLLNGKPLFQRLVLDQGFYPDGVYTAPSDEALRNDIVIAQGLGFNGARLHQKVFEPRFLYWADRLGYLVWGEFPSWGLELSDPKALEVFLPQWMEVLQRDYNHPSLVGWCPFNETSITQNPEVLRNVYRITKAYDATRPVIDTSGYVHVETDVYDVHNYDQNIATFAERFHPSKTGEPFRSRPDHDIPYQEQPYFVSEYGGIWWNPGQADEEAWGYGGEEARPRSQEEFLARYRALTETLLKHPRMCALCYTQLYDVEQEVNGLYTYDRRAKFDPESIRAINMQVAEIEK